MTVCFLTSLFLSKAIGFISALSLSIAFIAEYGYGILPCSLCLYERFVFAALIAIAILGKWKPVFIKMHLIALGAGVLLTFYHIGVEHHWWAAPVSCQSSLDAAETIEQLRALILEKRPAPCDKPGWIIFGVSAVTWTFFLFLGLLSALTMTCMAPFFARDQKNIP